MKKALFLLLMPALLIHGVAGLAATLQNTDSQPYDLQIQESGQSYGSHYTVIANSQVEICFYGCDITLLQTGQTVWVNPKDAVVIDDGVMNVASGD